MPAAAQTGNQAPWINVADNRAFTIFEVKTETKFERGSEYQLQTIRGTHGSGNLMFWLQKVGGSSATMASYDSALIDSRASNAAGVAASIGAPPAEVSNFAKTAGRFGRGATVDYKGCRFTWYGLRGNAEGQGFQILVSGMSCGDGAEFTRYLQEQIQVTGR